MKMNLKMKLKNMLGFAALCLSLSAFADPTIDLVPTKLEFKKQVDDDISLRYSQHVYLYIRNDGNSNFQSNNIFNIVVKGRTYRASVYGPSSEGGRRGGPIGPGKTGMLFMSLPLDTLRHCENVQVNISSLPQYHPYVNPRNNDQKTLQARDLASRFLCVRLPIDPVIRPRL